MLANVRFGSLGDIPPYRGHVRFTPESGHRVPRPRCLLSARSRRGTGIGNAFR